MRVEIISYTKEAEKYITAAAKLCYSKSDIDDIITNIDDENTEYFVDMLTEMGHESPLEHASYTFAIEGVSRSLLAQITRHRIASFSVQSQRYVNLTDFKYVIPPAISENPDALAEFLSAIEEDKKRYDKLSDILKKDHFKHLCDERGIAEIEEEYKSPSSQAVKEILRQASKLANEDARFILPNACETKMLMTMNARSLLNFFKLRTCQRAQWEIRNLAEEMLRQIKAVSPLLFKKAGPPCVYLGFCTEGKMSCGKSDEMKKKFTDL